MAIKTNWRGDRNATIVHKVASILRHAEFDTDVMIVIEAHPDTMPSIRYSITEDIVPDMVTEKENDNE